MGAYVCEIAPRQVGYGSAGDSLEKSLTAGTLLQKLSKGPNFAGNGRGYFISGLLLSAGGGRVRE